MAEHYLAVLESSGLAKVVMAPPGESPNAFAKRYLVLDFYTVKAEAQERCDVEDDPIKRELLMLGKLKVHKTG